MRMVVPLVVFFAWAVTASAQDESLEAARQLYTRAEYDAALAMLDRVAGTPAAAERDRAPVEHYRALCLLALHRPDDASAAVEAMVRHDPLYVPPEEDLAPRTRQLFRQVRLGLLPTLAQERYAKARAAYEAGRVEEAVAGFDAVVEMLDDVDAAGAAPPLVADLRVLATGFRQLALAAARPAPAPELPSVAASVTPAPQPPAEPVKPVTITPPVTVRQDVPPWPRELPAQPGAAVIEVVIGPDGRVLEARLQKPVHPRYDQLLLAAAAQWVYRPALRDGQPTPFVKAVRVELSARR